MRDPRHGPSVDDSSAGQKTAIFQAPEAAPDKVPSTGQAGCFYLGLAAPGLHEEPVVFHEGSAEAGQGHGQRSRTIIEGPAQAGP